MNEINLQDFKNNQQNIESEQRVFLLIIFNNIFYLIYFKNFKKTPDLFSVIKPVSNSSILKDQSLSSLLTNNSKKNAWSQLDPNLTDS